MNRRARDPVLRAAAAVGPILTLRLFWRRVLAVAPPADARAPFQARRRTAFGAVFTLRADLFPTAPGSLRMPQRVQPFLGLFDERSSVPEPRSPSARRAAKRVNLSQRADTERAWRQNAKSLDSPEGACTTGGLVPPPSVRLATKFTQNKRDARVPRTRAHGAFRSPRGQDKNTPSDGASRFQCRGAQSRISRVERRADLLLTRRGRVPEGKRVLHERLGRLAPEPLLVRTQKLHRYFIGGVPVKLVKVPRLFLVESPAGISITKQPPRDPGVLLVQLCGREVRQLVRRRRSVALLSRSATKFSIWPTSFVCCASSGVTPRSPSAAL